MRKIYIRIANKPIVLFVIVFLVIETFMESSTNLPMLGYAPSLVIIPFNYGDELINTLVFTMTLYVALVSKRIKWDEMCTFLAIRFLFVPIQLLMANSQGLEIRWGNYLFWILEFLLYLILKNLISVMHKNIIINIMKCFSIVISISIMFQAFHLFRNGMPYTHISYKACMQIPLGGSNSLAAIILPIVLGWIYEKRSKNIFSWIGISINAVAVFLTKSRAGMLILAILIVYYIILLIKKRKTMFVGIGIFILGAIGVTIFVTKNADIISMILAGFTSIYEGTSKLDSISSGRVSEMIEILRISVYSPIFGYGPNFESSRSHNLFVDVIYSMGIIGITFLIRSLIKITKIISNNHLFKKNSFFVIVFVSMLLNSMLEISIFNVLIYDVVFFLALLCATIDENEKE